MRVAVAERGLEHHVAKSGEEAVERVTAELADGGPGKATFDPLMGMYWMIVTHIAENTPLNVLILMAGNCPLCMANEGRAAAFPGGCGEPDCDDPVLCASPTYYDGWIDLAADGAAAEHVRLFGEDCRA